MRQLSPDVFLEAFRLVDRATVHPQVGYSHIALACEIEMSHRNAMDSKVPALELNEMEALGRAIGEACHREHVWPTDPSGEPIVRKILAHFNAGQV